MDDAHKHGVTDNDIGHAIDHADPGPRRGRLPPPGRPRRDGQLLEIGYNPTADRVLRSLTRVPVRGGELMRTEAQMLDEFESANHGEGPDPIASFDGASLQMILAAVRDRNAAQDRIEPPSQSTIPGRHLDPDR